MAEAIAASAALISTSASFLTASAACFSECARELRISPSAGVFQLPAMSLFRMYFSFSSSLALVA